jgi:hypothetical protein
MVILGFKDLKAGLFLNGTIRSCFFEPACSEGNGFAGGGHDRVFALFKGQVRRSGVKALPVEKMVTCN